LGRIESGARVGQLAKADMHTGAVPTDGGWEIQRFKGFLGAVLLLACVLAIFIGQQMISK
jgi:hypothetical protein